MFVKPLKNLIQYLPMSEKAAIREQLKEEFAYLKARKGGGVTLTMDAYSSKADVYYKVWNELLAQGELKSKKRRAWLQRTSTGLELQLK